MLEYARRLAAGQRRADGGALDLAFVPGDMAAFDFGARRFDLICVMLGTLCHLSDADSLRQCFACAARHLTPPSREQGRERGRGREPRPGPGPGAGGRVSSRGGRAGDGAVDWEGGLFVVELSHPAHVFSLLGPEGGRGSDAWEAPFGGDGGRVAVAWGDEEDAFDPVTQVLERSVAVGVFNGAGELVESLADTVPQRQFTVPELELLGRSAGLRLVGLYGDFDEGTDLSGGGGRLEDEYRMICCFRRAAPESGEGSG